MESTIINAKTLAYVELKTTHNRLHDDVEKAAGDFMATATQKLKVTGPMEFLYFGATGDMDAEYTLRIAYPVQEKTEAEGIKFASTEQFKCYSYNHKGTLSKLGSVYDKLFGEILAKQWVPASEIREVYHVYQGMEAPENLTEIQIGLN